MKRGTVVKLKSSPQLMTVAYWGGNAWDKVECVWIDRRGVPWKEEFAPDLLETVSD